MKIHLLDSNDPLQLGASQIAICGALVPQAQPAFMWDDALGPDYTEFLMSQPAICRRCTKFELEKRYIYGLIGGQSLIDEQQSQTRKEELISQKTD